MEKPPDPGFPEINTVQHAIAAALHEGYTSVRAARMMAREVERLRDKERTCNWVDDGDFYETGCGNEWRMTFGVFADVRMQYCPHCGGRIVEAAQATEVEEW